MGSTAAQLLRIRPISVGVIDLRSSETGSGTGVCAASSVAFLVGGMVNRRPASWTNDDGVLTATSYNRMVVLMTTTFDADTVFAALADATRRDIVLRTLNGREGVAELAEHYPMSFAAVQKHVAVLERAGLVTKQRDGRRKVVRTNMEALRLA